MYLNVLKHTQNLPEILGGPVLFQLWLTPLPTLGVSPDEIKPRIQNFLLTEIRSEMFKKI